MCPALGCRKKVFCSYIPHLKASSDGFDGVREEHASPTAMEFEFLDSFRQSSETLEQLVLVLTAQGQVMLGAVDKEAITNGADGAEDGHHQQDFPREPAQIRRAAQENSDIDR